MPYVIIARHLLDFGTCHTLQSVWYSTLQDRYTIFQGNRRQIVSVRSNCLGGIKESKFRQWTILSNTQLPQVTVSNESTVQFALLKQLTLSSFSVITQNWQCWQIWHFNVSVEVLFSFIIVKHFCIFDVESYFASVVKLEFKNTKQ